MAHTRNVIRHQVIPQLEGELSPQLRRVLARTARALAADDAFIEAAIRGGDVVGDAWGAWKLPAPLVTTADPAVAVRLVRRLLRAARPPYAGTAGELEAALDVVHGVTGRRDIADGWQVELEGPWLVVHRGGATEPAPVSCPVPGSARFGALTVVASPSPPVLVRRSSLVRADELGPVVELRAAAPGERIEIAAGSKLVRDVLAEAGIARRIRPAWPVAEAHGRIAAVVGVRTAPWARGAAGEEGVVELSVEEGKF
jgi:tRNA(Ile)-lysidine synthetase-like protein